MKRTQMSRTLSSSGSTRHLVKANLISPSLELLHLVLVDSGVDEFYGLEIG